MRLVERFNQYQQAYKSGKYNETQVRLEFINPLFAALGWDVDNRTGAPEAYKDVIHEAVVKVGGVTKAPDYSFNIGGERKFFLEAKKPSVNLKDDINPAFQLRRYAWSATLPLSILTDFEEFVVYDCRIEPSKKDTAATARALYVPYQDYEKRWGEIAEVFSRDAVLAGSLDQYAESLKTKKGSSTVDVVFLREIEAWRDQLARNLAFRNPGLTQRALNFAVQMTIDRIIFLRMAEDRGIEEYGRLQELLKGEKTYERLVQKFRQADDRYNSGLFHFKREKGRPEDPDDLTLSLSIDDDPLKDIIKHLYYPDSPYEFSVLPIELLGHVYEQFLGKVIRLTDGHRAVVEEKPEVRKAGGVYYTPTYIVDYIVKHTVGKLLKDKTPRQVAGTGKTPPIRIVDPACGSGSFLIGAYQYLLDWYRDQYIEQGVEKHKKELYQGKGGAWRLTTAERKRILLSHIYGVDIDSQAVEVTKLSLLLKVLEGENKETLTHQLTLFQERALPDLANNIKCGNSLIDSEVYAGQQLGLLDDEERYRLNVFDWTQAFPDVFTAANPGFDTVIGNPPYIRIQTMKEWAPLEVEYYKQAYKSAAKGNYDIYVVFVERGLSLLNDRGRLGFILPHKFFNAQYGQPLRTLLAEGGNLADIVHFGDEQIFTGATTYTCLLFLEKKPQKSFNLTKVHSLVQWRQGEPQPEGQVEIESTRASEWNFTVGQGNGLFEKLSRMPTKLGATTRIFQGLVTGADKVFILEQAGSTDNALINVIDQQGTSWMLEREILKPFIYGKTVSTYERPNAHHWIIYPYKLHETKAVLIPANELAGSYPHVWEYLEHHSNTLRGREGGKWDHEHWYAFGRTQNLTQMDNPKLIVQVISLYGRYAFDDSGIYFTGGGNGPYYGIRWNTPDNAHSLHYLQAILSSRVLDWYLRTISSPFRGGYWSYGKRFIEQLPIRLIDFNTPFEQSVHDHVVGMVREILRLNKQLAEMRTPHEKAAVQHQVSVLDAQINSSIYELYELTNEEIMIIEHEA